jgi:hypothetical protein
MPEQRATAPSVTLHQLAAGFGARSVLRQLTLTLEPGQDLTLAVMPSPMPTDGLRVRTAARPTAMNGRG